MKISNIQYTNIFTPNISFKNNSDKVSKDTRRKEFYEDNFNEAYNTEYTPIKYEKTTMVKGRPLRLASERMFKPSKSTLREEELFYPEVDSTDFVPTKYDTDDVPLDKTLWLKPFIREEDYLYAPEAGISSTEYYGYDSINHPWKDKKQLEAEEELEKYKDATYIRLRNTRNIDYKTMQSIFKSSSIIKNGRLEVDKTLCNLAIKVFKNSDIWGDTEKAIMDEIRIPIYKKVYGDYSRKKYIFVKNSIILDRTNEEILKRLRTSYAGYVELD